MNPTERRSLLVGVGIVLAALFGYEAILAYRESASRRAREEANRPICPNCGPGEHVIEWRYGKPSRDSSGNLSFPPGRYKHGGCLVTEASPAWHCETCERDWGWWDLDFCFPREKRWWQKLLPE